MSGGIIFLLADLFGGGTGVAAQERSKVMRTVVSSDGRECSKQGNNTIHLNVTGYDFRKVRAHLVLVSAMERGGTGGVVVMAAPATETFTHISS